VLRQKNLKIYLALGLIALLAIGSFFFADIELGSQEQALPQSIEQSAQQNSRAENNVEKKTSSERDLQSQSQTQAKKTLPEEILFEGEVFLDETRLAFQQIKKTSFKYPFLATQELWAVLPQDPFYKEYLGRREMVADHLLVKLYAAEQKAQFESSLASMGMKIRLEMNGEDLFLVEFPLAELDSLQNAQKRLLSLPEVRSVLPDFLSDGF
jgi:hypothetical protein